MTTIIFISGSMNIRHIDAKVKERIFSILEKNHEIVVGDADGSDKSIQQYLCESGATKVTVFCSGDRPRNNVGNWPIRSVQTNHAEGSRAFFTAKDICMAEIADAGLMIWDAKSTGTLSNVTELLARRKKSVVFVNKAKKFQNVTSVEQLEELVAHMSSHAKIKANEKIRLRERIDALKHEQFQMFV